MLIFAAYAGTLAATIIKNHWMKMPSAYRNLSGPPFRDAQYADITAVSINTPKQSVMIALAMFIVLVLLAGIGACVFGMDRRPVRRALGILGLFVVCVAAGTLAHALLPTHFKATMTTA